MSLLKSMKEDGALNYYLRELVEEVEEDLECNVDSLYMVLKSSDGVCMVSLRERKE